MSGDEPKSKNNSRKPGGDPEGEPVPKRQKTEADGKAPAAAPDKSEKLRLLQFTEGMAAATVGRNSAAEFPTSTHLFVANLDRFGRGLFSLREFKAKEVVALEAPYRSQASNEKKEWQANVDGVDVPAWLLQTLSVGNFRAKTVEHPTRKQQVWDNNQFGYDVAGQDENWLFPAVSLINHSCEPNVDIVPRCVDGVWLGELFAVRDIAPGDQLFVDYIKTWTLGTGRSMLPFHRVTRTLERYGFPCTCRLCQTDGRAEAYRPWMPVRISETSVALNDSIRGRLCPSTGQVATKDASSCPSGAGSKS